MRGNGFAISILHGLGEFTKTHLDVFDKDGYCFSDRLLITYEIDEPVPVDYFAIIFDNQDLAGEQGDTCFPCSIFLLAANLV